jgi:hypothetical protein
VQVYPFICWSILTIYIILQHSNKELKKLLNLFSRPKNSIASLFCSAKNRVVIVVNLVVVVYFNLINYLFCLFIFVDDLSLFIISSHKQQHAADELATSHPQTAAAAAPAVVAPSSEGSTAASWKDELDLYYCFYLLSLFVVLFLK